ncbi:MAG TPA: EAL domain-containing protein [Symbiobacteriaceae bacterium]|nr:EAL domain-containing protein [Symbiobacteriaceae bacterium]
MKRQKSSNRSLRVIPILSVVSFVIIAFSWAFGSEAIIVHVYPSHAPGNWIELIQDALGILVEALLLYLLLKWLLTRALASESERQRISNLFEAVIEASPEGITVLDTQGRVKLWNSGAERIFGWSRAEVLDQVLPTVPPEKMAEFTVNLERSLAGEVCRSRFTQRQRRDGTAVDVRVSTAPLRDQNGEVAGIVSIVADISNQRQAEKALNRYRLLADHTREIVLFLRLADGRIMDANKAAVEAYGYSFEQLCNLTIWDLRRTASQADVSQLMQRAFNSGIIHESCHTRQDGSSFPVEVSSTGAMIDGEPVLVSIIRDITERRRREQVRNLAYELDRRILLNEPMDSLLSTVGRSLADLYGADMVTTTIKSETGRVLHITSYGVACVGVGETVLDWDHPNPELSPSAKAIVSGVLSVGDLRDEPVVGEWRERLRAAGLTSYAALPLIARGDAFGALVLYSNCGRAFCQEIVNELVGFAGQVATSIVSARAQHQIRLQKAALEATANAVLIAERNGKIVWVNPAFTRLTGYLPAEALGRTPRIIKSGTHSAAFYKRLWDTVSSGMTWQGEIENRRKDGTLYLEEQTITPVLDAQGNVTHFIAIKQDVSERKRRESELQYLMQHDPLTGLANRAALEEWLNQVIAGTNTGLVGAFALLDVDKFNAVNDTMGHPTGDQLLIHLAELLKQAVRPGDLVARYGDDEFAIVAKGISFAEGRELAEQIRMQVESAQWPIDGLLVKPTVSIGLVSIDGKQDVETLMVSADTALYQAKEGGRNRVVVHVAGQEGADQATAPARWASRIKDALQSDQFVLHYQPVVRLATGSIDHYEALIRMQGADGAVTPPGEFLGAAEQYNLMPLIDRWVVDAALAELRMNDTLRLFVNLSGQSLNNESFLGEIAVKIRECGPGVASRLTFEITETVAVQHLTRAQQWLDLIDKLGCRFALDDFGMGFSSFGYLQALPVHYIKIDGSFVRNIDTSVTDRELVQAITAVAHTLGKVVIAEWVESPAIARILSGFGVAYGQGFSLGRPAPDRIGNPRAAHPGDQD